MKDLLFWQGVWRICVYLFSVRVVVLSIRSRFYPSCSGPLLSFVGVEIFCVIQFRSIALCAPGLPFISECSEWINWKSTAVGDEHQDKLWLIGEFCSPLSLQLFAVILWCLFAWTLTPLPIFLGLINPPWCLFGISYDCSSLIAACTWSVQTVVSRNKYFGVGFASLAMFRNTTAM